MADPIGNYLAGLGFLGGPEVNPGALTPEQLAQLGLSKFLPVTPIAPANTPEGAIPVGGAGVALAKGPALAKGLQNMADLGQYGLDPDAMPFTQDQLAGKSFQAVKDILGVNVGIPKPPGSAGSFGGPLAEGWSPEASAKYRDMLREGYTPQDATKETGIFRTADRRQKFEIPDTASSLTNKATNELMRYGPGTTISGNLSDFLNHPQLYENYPGMKNLPTSISLLPPQPSGQMNYSGVYRPGSQSLVANSSYIEGPEGIQSILMHEAGGHHIQQLENFAKGSSPEAEREIGKNFLDHLIYKRLSERNKPNPDMDLIQRLSSMEKEFKNTFNPFDAYQRSAGEVDARAIQERMMMTPAGLRAISPADTAAGLMPFNRQIVRFND